MFQGRRLFHQVRNTGYQRFIRFFEHASKCTNIDLFESVYLLVCQGLQGIAVTIVTSVRSTAGLEAEQVKFACLVRIVALLGGGRHCPNFRFYGSRT